jgi:hypothetical protein
MTFRTVCSLGAAATILPTLVGGCVVSAGATLGPPAGCSVDSSVVCQEAAAQGWSCAPGDNPEAEQGGLSCSYPTTLPDGSDGYCCFDWTYGTTTCTPDDTIVCPASDSFGYRCATGDDPTSLDSSLNCSTPTPDPTAGEDDFCCY